MKREMVAIALMLACGVVLEMLLLKRPPSFAGSFRPRVDETSEATCAHGGQASASPSSEICINGPNERTYQKGESIAATVTWANAPAGSAIMVYLDRDDRRRGSGGYLGWVGPLAPQSTPVAGAGRMRFVWDGRNLPCVGEDYMPCERRPEIGRYRLRAILYDDAGPLVSGMAPVLLGESRPKPPTELVHSTSVPFVIDGVPDLAPLARTLWGAAFNAADKKMNVHDALVVDFRSGAVAGTGAEVFRRGNRLCTQIDGRLPYLSSLEACVPTDDFVGDAGLRFVEPEQVQVTGSVRRIFAKR